MARSIEEIRNDIAEVQKAIDEINARKEKRGHFSSEQIAQMYSLDPKAAEFFANKQAQEAALKTKEEIAILPKDRSMTVDQIRQQLRIASEGAIRKMEATPDPNLKELYKKEMEVYVAEAAKDVPSIQLASTAVNELYKTGGQGPDKSALDWWNSNKPTQELIKKYGITDAGGIKDLTNLKTDVKNLARGAGYTSLDKTIEDYIDSVNKDMENAVIAARGKSEFELGQAGKIQQLTQDKKDSIYKDIDTKYPNLREKEIPNANKLIGFIIQGDSGSTGSRNNAVKSLSRLGSDEALSETDFGRALGRSGVLSTLTNWANANVPITDAEWNKVKSDIISAISGVRNRRLSAIREFTPKDYKGPVLLEDISTLSMNADMNAGKSLLKSVEIKQNDPRLKGLTGLARARKIKELQQGGK